ncbi:heavy-metal-associated domain-containing protein [Clostridium sp. P21]|uniref:Heavy-metal-associated domain-containing protein n=1 Tax=Clostridium muellerianum TaxID=2716538 RepID=A0A7Y0EDS0_9CLOT|nr:heavy-metal-associated domain-containing protein [Clostridium muellerianum]NMM61639.1 heavy-metal-associated domain-containing protein [Clostridium muellerianum]
MKSVLKVHNMNTAEDVNMIRAAVSSNEGVVACQINKDKGEINIVYDDYFVTNDRLVQSIEDLGVYSILKLSLKICVNVVK